MMCKVDVKPKLPELDPVIPYQDRAELVLRSATLAPCYRRSMASVVIEFINVANGNCNLPIWSWSFLQSVGGHVIAVPNPEAGQATQTHPQKLWKRVGAVKNSVLYSRSLPYFNLTLRQKTQEIWDLPMEAVLEDLWDRSTSLIPTRHNMMSSLKTVSIGPIRADNSASNSHTTSQCQQSSTPIR